MITAVALLTRKPGLSHADFVEYYETRHSVLIRELLPPIVEYRRNFVDRDSLRGTSGAPEPDFDVITELVFADRAGYEEMLALTARPEVASAIAADEANFADRSRTRMFLVETRAN